MPNLAKYMEDAIGDLVDATFEPNGYDYKNPADATWDSEADPLIRALIDTAAFERLREIRFLGAIDYRLVRSPNGQLGATRYTRYQHSLGVLRLALLYCRLRDIGTADRQLISAAALLHDIGHPPLSHSMEPLFREDFGIDHHKAAEDIVTGRVDLGRDVVSTLRRFNIDVNELLELISGRADRFDGFFSGPINFDTIEGVLRTCNYVQSSNRLSPDTVTIAATTRNGLSQRVTVDEFWTLKEVAYRTVINTPEGILADLVARTHMKQELGDLGVKCFFDDDRKLFARLPRLKELIANSSIFPTTEITNEPIRYASRHYYVDEDGDFFARNDLDRYKHRRNIETLALGANFERRGQAAAVVGNQCRLF